MKKYITILSAVFTTILVIAFGFEYAKADDWSGWKYSDGTNATVDTTVVYPGNESSIKITNTDYTIQAVTRTFDVKPNTTYRASAMAKNENYSLASGAAGEGGAKLGIPDGYLPGTPCYSGSEWKKLSFEFTTETNQTTYTIAMWNGIWGADCKGTAYFSDFRIEEAEGEKTNEWNALVLVFKNIAAPVESGGRKYVYKEKLNNADVKYMGKIISQIYTSIPRLSDGLWNISAVDVYGIDTTVTNLTTYGKKSYCIDYYDSVVSKEIDSLMESAYQNSGRTYDQIIIISPILGELSEEWLGLGGTDYYGTRICQLNYKSGSKSYSGSKYSKGYEETAVVHEMLHGIETLTHIEDPDNFVKFHANIDEYAGLYSDLIKQKGLTSWGAYHSDYMRCATPDGKGVNQNVFLHDNQFKWKVVYGKPLKQPAKIDIQSLDVKEITAKTYTGKAITPDVTIYDGDYRLVKGNDYTLSYQSNTKTGKAAVIITGKGKYAGTYCKTFNIIPKQANVSATKTNGGYKLSWKKLSGADKIQIYVAKKGSTSFKLKKTIKGTSVSAVIALSKGDKVKIRSYKSIYPQKYYSNFSKVVTV